MKRKKLTYGFVKESFKKEGYTLISNTYKNNYTKLDYICPNKHKHSIAWNSWQQGSRCPYCIGNVKLTIEFIRSEFKKEGYKLLSKEYINSKSKLEYVCPKSHKHSITWDNWRSGKRCTYCAGLVKPSYEHVKNSFEKEGYTLLSKKYIDSKTKLYYICPGDHKHLITWNNWQRGRRCPYCYGQVKLKIEEVKNSFEEEGYTLLSKKYINAHIKLKYICPEEHEHNIKWGHWQQGHRCPTCAKLNRFGSGNPSWKGGISCEPYCPVWTDREFKNDIKERDDYKCQNPDCWKTTNKLVLHHIDYDKKNCNPNNLITVCNSCNIRANKDREWHTAWYQAIMNKKI
jgi:hypothetical protein